LYNLATALLNEITFYKVKRLSLLFTCLVFVMNTHLIAQKIQQVSRVFSMEGDEVHVPTLWYNEPVVFFFYSVDCPLCRNYTKTINDLSKEFEGRVDFYMVFSGKHQKKIDIDNYIEKYKLKVKILRDRKFNLSDVLEANITPEAVLVKDGYIFYSGALDDWVIRLGNTKKKAREFYLKDAINNVLAGEKVNPKHVKAIGCYIK